MDITIHGYTATGAIDATIEGQRMTVPDDMANRHRQMIAEWEAAGHTIPAYVAPGPSADDAKAMIITSIDAATASIINAYPTSERLGWDAKAAEAAAVLAAGAGATLAMAPLLTAECAAEYGAADDATRLTQLAAKAQTVLEKAAAWGQLMATLSGLRGKAFAAIDAAGNDAEALQAAVDTASAEIVAAASLGP